MKIVPLKEINLSEQIIEKLKGKKFIAIVIEEVKGGRDYNLCLSEAMTSEVIVYACNFAINQTIHNDFKDD